MSISPHQGRVTLTMSYAVPNVITHVANGGSSQKMIESIIGTCVGKVYVCGGIKVIRESELVVDPYQPTVGTQTVEFSCDGVIPARGMCFLGKVDAIQANKVTLSANNFGESYSLIMKPDHGGNLLSIGNPCMCIALEAFTMANTNPSILVELMYPTNNIMWACEEQAMISLTPETALYKAYTKYMELKELHEQLLAESPNILALRSAAGTLPPEPPVNNPNVRTLNIFDFITANKGQMFNVTGVWALTGAIAEGNLKMWPGTPPPSSIPRLRFDAMIVSAIKIATEYLYAEILAAGEVFPPHYFAMHADYVKRRSLRM